MPTHSDVPPGTGLTRALSVVMIVLMLGAIIYASWIVLRNWHHIGV